MLEREIDFEGFKIQIIRKAYSRSLRLKVHTTGEIKLHTNVKTPLHWIYKFLNQQKNWLEQSSLKMEALRAKNPPKSFRQGEIFPYLGQNYQLQIRHSSSLALTLGENVIYFDMPISEDDLTDEARNIYFSQFKKTFKRAAEKVMSERLSHYQKEMQLFASRLHFGMQKTLWGSCSSSNRISLNYKLIVAPLEVIDYVIVHELSHIRHKNHSKDFWKLVDQFILDKEKSKLWLKENVNCGEFLKS